MKTFIYPALTFIGNTSRPIENYYPLQILIKKLLTEFYQTGHRMILTGTRPGYERLVMECAAELIDNYECQGYYLFLLNCAPELRPCVKKGTHIHFVDHYLPTDRIAELRDFLYRRTTYLFLYDDPTDPDPLTDALGTAARKTAIPIFNVFGLMRDKVLF